MDLTFVLTFSLKRVLSNKSLSMSSCNQLTFVFAIEIKNSMVFADHKLSYYYLSLCHELRYNILESIYVYKLMHVKYLFIFNRGFCCFANNLCGMHCAWESWDVVA